MTVGRARRRERVEEALSHSPGDQDLTGTEACHEDYVIWRGPDTAHFGPPLALAQSWRDSGRLSARLGVSGRWSGWRLGMRLAVESDVPSRGVTRGRCSGAPSTNDSEADDKATHVRAA